MKYKHVSSRNANGGFPSGPFHEGPPITVVSTNKAFKGVTKAMGSASAIERVIGVTMIEIARQKRAMKVDFEGGELSSCGTVISAQCAGKVSPAGPPDRIEAIDMHEVPLATAL